MTAPIRPTPPEPTADAEPAYRPGDRVALVHTADPYTRLQPGDQGTVTRWHPTTGQLAVDWDCGSSLFMLPHDGDQIRLLTPHTPTG